MPPGRQGSVLARLSMRMAAWAAARATSRYVMLPANSRPVTSMMSSKTEYFTQPGARGWFVTRVFREFGCRPVDRGDPHVAASTIDTGVALFAAGKAVGIYPEGTRSPHGRLHKFRTGSRDSRGSGAPVIPVGLVGTG